MTWPSEPQNPYQPPPEQPATAPPPFVPPYGQHPYGGQPYPDQGYPTQPYAAQPYTGQPYQPYQPQHLGLPYQAFPPPRRHSRALPWLITAGVLLAVALMIAVALPVVRQSTARCGSERAPFGASHAAAAYVSAVNAATPGWLSMSKTIQDQDYKVRPDQMSIQLEADRQFLTALKSISFPAPQQPAAQNLVTAVEQYDAFVQTASQNPGYLSAHQSEDRALNDARAAASNELRRELRLPASLCTYYRP